MIGCGRFLIAARQSLVSLVTAAAATPPAAGRRVAVRVGVRARSRSGSGSVPGTAGRLGTDERGAMNDLVTGHYHGNSCRGGAWINAPPAGQAQGLFREL